MENVKKPPTKLEKLIFTLKLLYRATGIICHVAPNIRRIFLKNIFSNLLKILRLTRSFTNFSHIPNNYDLPSRGWF